MLQWPEHEDGDMDKKYVLNFCCETQWKVATQNCEVFKIQLMEVGYVNVDWTELVPF